MSLIANKKDAYLPKTPLDYIVESVEHKYGSVAKAPQDALDVIHSYVNHHNMAKHGHFHHKHNKSKRWRRIIQHMYNSIQIYRIGDQWFTDYKPLAYMSMLVNDHRTIEIASQLSNVSIYYFHKLVPSKKTVIYHYKGINFKFNSYHKLIDMCSRMLDWYFAPQTMYQLKHHDYKGKVDTYHKYVALNYRRK